MRYRLDTVVVARLESPDAVKLDVEALVDASVVTVPDAEVKLVIDEVASDVRPLSTDKVPLDVKDVVARIVPPVIEPDDRDVINAVTPLMREAKRLVEVAFPDTRLVAEALVDTKFVDVPFTLLKLVIVPDATVKLVVDATVAERLEMVVVASTDVPVAVKVPATKLEVVA